MYKNHKGKNRRYPNNVYEVAAILKKRYNDFSHNNPINPLDDLLFIMSSIKTTGVSYENTYSKFRKAFPRFKDIAGSSVEEMTKFLSSGGLQNIKAKYIKQITESLTKKFGRPTLVPLKKMSNEKCEELLTSLPGVGKKAARCVMMYSLGRKTFPVDTHCWRISQRLGWIRPNKQYATCTEKYMDRLQDKIPPDLRFSLHVNMVSLGREFCTYYNPKCSTCPIERLCKRVSVRRYQRKLS